MRSVVAFTAMVVCSASYCSSWGIATSYAETKEQTVAGRTVAGWSADLHSSNVIVRLRAVRSLERFGVSAVPALTAALGDREDGVRAAAAGALGEIGPAAATARQSLQRLLDDRSIGVAMHAAYALCRLGDRDRPVAVLCKALEHPARGVANTAADLLGRAEVAEALPALAKTLEQSDYHLKGAAAHAIARIKQKRDAPP